MVMALDHELQIHTMIGVLKDTPALIAERRVRLGPVHCLDASIKHKDAKKSHKVTVVLY